MQDQQVSHYRLTEKLGAGTYGEVWKGVHVDDPDFMVAVKLVSPQVREDPAFLDALRKECRALDRMDHPSIVRFRELVVREDTVAMVLELLEGADLEALLAAGPQPVDEVVRVLEKVLDGLAYAHGKGVVHRDIKPGNIFRCTDGRVKLMDFGIARAADGTQATQTGTLKGTLDYMAPERFSQAGGGPAADVYAVGLLGWELLAGRRACQGADLPQKLGWHLGVGIPDVRTVRPDCPAWLAELVSALGAKDAATRPADGGAALAHLRSLDTGSSSGSAPVSTPPAAPRTVRLTQAQVAASLPPATPQTGPGTVALPAPGLAAEAPAAVEPAPTPAAQVLDAATPAATPAPASHAPAAASGPAPSTRTLQATTGVYILVCVLIGVFVNVLRGTESWMDVRGTVGLVTCPIVIGLNVALFVLARSIPAAGRRAAVRIGAVVFTLWTSLHLGQSNVSWDETFFAFVAQGVVTIVLARVGGSKAPGP